MLVESLLKNKIDKFKVRLFRNCEDEKIIFSFEDIFLYVVCKLL